jgi:type I restriction enzyme, S subunit
MREGWPIKNIGDVCDLMTGGTPSKSKAEYFEGGKINWLVSGDVNKKVVKDCDGRITQLGLENSNAKYLPVNSVMIALNGQGKTRGTVALLKIKATCNQSLVSIYPKDVKQLMPEYLYANLHGRYEEIRKVTGDSGNDRRGLNMPLIRSIRLPIPPLPEQKRIVAILDEAFDGIDRAVANAEKNLANARELFENYLNNVFTEKGEGWEVKQWGELCHFVRGPFGGSLKKSMFKDKGYAVYEQKHAIHDHFNQLRYFIDENKFNEMKRFEVKPGDLIMSCSGVTLGKVAVIPDNIPKGIINQALLKLTPNKLISVHYLKHWLRSKVFQDIIFKHSGGAAIPNVPSVKTLKEIFISLPSPKEQEGIVDNIESMLTETKRLESTYKQKLTALNELKQSLLQKAFSGELTADVSTKKEAVA